MWFGVDDGSAQASPQMTIKMQDTNTIWRITADFFINTKAVSRE
jgi:hypothetical protein